MEKFEWWLVNEQEAAPELETLTPAVIRGFLTYLQEDLDDGRFGGDHPNARGPARPSTVATYHRCLRAFVNWCRAEEWIVGAPLKNVKVPRLPQDHLDHFTDDEMQALVNAARRGRQPNRDVAILLLLLDTGLRASELCGLDVGDADQQTSSLMVLGKGNKTRKVYICRPVRLALWNYLQRDRGEVAAGDPLFLARGGDRMTRNGLFQMVDRLAGQAGLSGSAGCHKIRRTYAINFLRRGGNLYELQKLMGHTDLTVLRRYVKYGESDLSGAARRHSPVEGMGIR